MLLVSSQCVEVLRAYVNNLFDDFVIHQALANPRKSQELKEFVHDIFHSETSALMREHNDIIQTQRDQILSLNSEIDKIQHERMDNINTHAAEIKGLHSVHAAETQALHREYTDKLRDAVQGRTPLGPTNASLGQILAISGDEM